MQPRRVRSLAARQGRGDRCTAAPAVGDVTGQYVVKGARRPRRLWVDIRQRVTR